MTKVADKRQHPRYDLVLPIKYQLLAPDGGDHGCGISRSIDLSRGGLKLIGSANATVKDRIVITIQKAKETLTIYGQVRWIHQLAYRQCEIGVHFEEITLPDEERLMRLLDSLSNSLTAEG